MTRLLARAARLARPLAPCLVVFALGTASGCNKANGAAAEASAEPASSEKPAGHGATARRVEVATLTATDAGLSLSLPGEVEPAREAMLAAALGGFIEKVAVKTGQNVKKGAVLVLVDTATHEARVAQARVEVAAAKRELERAQKLGDVLPRAQLDAAEVRVQAARAGLRLAEVQASRAYVYAPFDGVIADVEAEEGEVAAPGMPLVRLLALDPAKVTVSLSDRDVGVVREGMRATVTTDAGGRLLEGTVQRINPAADTRTRSFVVDIEVPNPNREILPGMIASVRIEAGSGGKAMVIAQDWLVTRPNELGVFLLEDGVARFRTVELGPVLRDRVVVDKGLSGGETLIITGHRELSDGDELIVARRGSCCENGRVVFE